MPFCHPCPREAWLRRLSVAPSKKPCPLVKPWILRDHLARAGQAVGKQPNGHKRRRSNDVSAHGPQLALVERINQEPCGSPQQGAIDEKMPHRLPCCRQ